MKSYKTMLLGIAFILFGVACRAKIIGFMSIYFFEEMVAAYFPFIGIIIVLVGYFTKDNSQKK